MYMSKNSVRSFAGWTCLKCSEAARVSFRNSPKLSFIFNYMDAISGVTLHRSKNRFMLRAKKIGTAKNRTICLPSNPPPSWRPK